MPRLTENLTRPEGVDSVMYAAIKRKASNFFVENGVLKKRSLPVSQVVVTSERAQDWILLRLHVELGHRGVEETYRRVVLRFWWPSLKKCVKTWVQSCEACQKRSALTPKEVGHATGEATLFGRISLDAVHIKLGQYRYLIVARDDLSGWVEASPLITLKADRVAQFLQEEWIYRFGAIKMVSVDGGLNLRMN